MTSSTNFKWVEIPCPRKPCTGRIQRARLDWSYISVVVCVGPGNVPVAAEIEEAHDADEESGDCVKSYLECNKCYNRFSAEELLAALPATRCKVREITR